jgi:hypothetical protein
MRRTFFGLLFFSLTACSGAIGGESSTARSDPGGSPEKLSSAGQPRHPQNNKQVLGAPRLLPLSSAAAYASEHPAALPNSSAPRPMPPSSNTFYFQRLVVAC